MNKTANMQRFFVDHQKLKHEKMPNEEKELVSNGHANLFWLSRSIWIK